MMNYKFRHATVYLLLSTFYLLLVSCSQHTPYYRYELREQLTKPPYINVLLTAYRNVAEATISLSGRYRIVPYEPSRAAHFMASRILLEAQGENDIRLNVIDGKIKVNETILDVSDMVLVPVTDHYIRLGGRAYRGNLRIKVTPNHRLQLGNIIDLESYLYGVVGCEMDTRYPESALAAQAIAARTLAIFRMKRMHLKRYAPSSPFSAEDDFDLTDDVYAQVYAGMEREDKKSREAVDKTRGVILSYEGAVFEGLFHDTCGGHTEPAHLLWGGPVILPLSGRPCPFCTHSRFNQWKATFSEKEIIRKLSLDTDRIEDIIVLAKGPGGHIMMLGIQIPGRRTALEIKAEKFREALGYQNLRSTLFYIRRIPGYFEFIGQGWGHGVGMCQEGANGMARRGFNTLQILEYYYPEAKVVKIY